MRKVLSFIMVLIVIFTLCVNAFAETMWKSIEVNERVNFIDGKINLADYGLKTDDVIGIDIRKGKDRANLYYTLESNTFNVKSELELNTDYALRVITNNEKYELKFKTSDLPDISETGESIIVKVPAMPEKGFNFPYYLRIPSNVHKNENQGYKRYVHVDTTNVGNMNLESTSKAVEEVIKELRSFTVHLSDTIWTPFIMPVIPNTNIGYMANGKFNSIYENAFDRDTANLHNIIKDERLYKELSELYTKKGLTLENYLKLDEQIIAMFNHAAEYLNKYGHKVEVDKMVLNGYSASGTFTDRFTALHPDKVKAVVSGATLDDMILPLSTYKNEKLIFPIGTYDYKEITGREFNLAKHNSVARLVYMGEDDTNNTVPYNDCYGDTEREIIIKLWGVDVLPRAKELISLYGQSGGKGMFILDKGIDHSKSNEMYIYIEEFLKQNRNSDKPVYSIPKNPQQLKYTIYQ